MRLGSMFGAPAARPEARIRAYHIAIMAASGCFEPLGVGRIPIGTC